MRIDEEPILGEPVTIDMPNACINPVDFSKTWIDKYGISREKDLTLSNVRGGKTKIMGKYCYEKAHKRLKTV